MNPLIYEPRDCHFIGIKQFEGQAQPLQFKLYLICSSQYSIEDLPSETILRQLYQKAFGDWGHPNDHEVAFAILHLADDGLYFLTSIWNDANMLRHKVLGLTNTDGKVIIEPLAEPSIIACIWELKLMSFERDLWIDCVLSHNPESLQPELICSYLGKYYQGKL